MASRRIVVDTSIARAAGPEDATHTTSINCRDFLKAMQEHRHQMVMTPALVEEWREHSSKFAVSWRASMYARKLVCFQKVDIDTDLSSKIATCSLDAGVREAVIKDYLLIEASLCTDKRISSLDDVVRGHFAAICQTVKEIGDILWINPDTDIEATDWLKNGAPDDAARHLKNHHPNHPHSRSHGL